MVRMDSVGGFLEKAFRVWWVIETSTLELDFLNKHFAVSGFFGKAPRGVLSPITA